MNRTRAFLAAIVVIGMLGGCAPSDAEPTPPPVAEAPSETPTPTPEPTKPAIGELILSPDGLANVVIGEEPPVVDPQLDILIFDADACQADFDDGAITEPGKWLPNYGVPFTADSPFSAFVTDGIVREIAIFDPEITTEGGLGLGSTRQEVLDAYPDAEMIPNGNTDLFVVSGDHGGILFEIGADDNSEYAKGEVVFLRVNDLHEDRLYGWANTDAGHSYCVNA